jgi:hypothetical protein
VPIPLHRLRSLGKIDVVGKRTVGGVVTRRSWLCIAHQVLTAIRRGVPLHRQWNRLTC